MNSVNSNSWLMTKVNDDVPKEPLMVKVEKEELPFDDESYSLPANPQTTTQVKVNTYYNDIITFHEIPDYDYQDYDIYDDKDFEKYIKDIENVVRQSREYRLFVDYLRENMDMNKCSFFENVSNKDTFKIKIQLHHSPLTLYEIVRTIFNKRLFYHESLEIEMVAEEVMYVHYFLLVGIIPLSETVHELVHSQSLFIPLGKSMGNWEEFMEIYKEFIPDETKDKIDSMRTKSLAYDSDSNLSILEQSPVILQLPGDTGEGLYNLPQINSIEDSMMNRISEIRQNRYQMPVDPSVADNSQHSYKSKKEVMGR